jgi:hypothetical protein
LSATEKTAKSEESVEEPSLFEVENALTVIGLKHFVEKA